MSESAFEKVKCLISTYQYCGLKYKLVKKDNIHKKFFIFVFFYIYIFFKIHTCGFFIINDFPIIINYSLNKIKKLLKSMWIYHFL